MRPTTVLALTALLGLSACDASKMGAPLGSKPSTTMAAACPATPAPACPPAVSGDRPVTMEPEGAAVSTAPAANAKPAASVSHVNWARPAAKPHHSVRKVIVYRQASPPKARVHRNVYAGGYTGTSMNHGDDGYSDGHQRHYETPRVYVTPEVRYGHSGYDYADRDEGQGNGSHYEHYTQAPVPYVAPRMEDRRTVEVRRYVAPPVYVAPREHVYVETRGYQAPPAPPPVVERRVYREVAPNYRYESRDSRYEAEASSYRPVPRPPVIEDDCRCQTTQAAGRDRQGFLTWPGKRP
jgi:hypothetical protein